jgi:hypothetical protein
VIASREHPTLSEVRHSGKNWDFDSRPKIPGDGRVGESQAVPPLGIPYQIVYSEAEHSDLLNDPKIIAWFRNTPLQ